jgi:hypothetical protein
MVGGLSQAPIDTTSMTNIYGFDGMNKYNSTTGGLDAVSSAAVRDSIQVGYNYLNDKQELEAGGKVKRRGRGSWKSGYNMDNSEGVTIDSEYNYNGINGSNLSIGGGKYGTMGDSDNEGGIKGGIRIGTDGKVDGAYVGVPMRFGRKVGLATTPSVNIDRNIKPTMNLNTKVNAKIGKSSYVGANSNTDFNGNYDAGISGNTSLGNNIYLGGYAGYGNKGATGNVSLIKKFARGGDITLPNMHYNNAVAESSARYQPIQRIATRQQGSTANIYNRNGYVNAIPQAVAPNQSVDDTSGHSNIMTATHKFIEPVIENTGKFISKAAPYIGKVAHGAEKVLSGVAGQIPMVEGLMGIFGGQESDIATKTLVPERFNRNMPLMRRGGKIKAMTGMEIASLATVPLSLGSGLMDNASDEYGVIDDMGSYTAGAVLNPIGFLGDKISTGFKSQSALRKERANKVMGMTNENLSNEQGIKDAQQYSTDYDRLRNFNNKGGKSVLNFAKGGRLSSSSMELDGATHAQGGIDITNNVEAEDGEVLNKAGNGDTQVFSEQLGYADAVKPLLQKKGELEKQLMLVAEGTVGLQKTYEKSKDNLRRGTVARNMQKSNDSIFMIKAAISQIDQQVQVIFAQQQKQNGQQTAEAQMRNGGVIARNGIEIPPYTGNKTLSDDMYDSDVYMNWLNTHDYSTFDEYAIQDRQFGITPLVGKPGYVARTPNYAVPYDESLNGIHNIAYQTNTPKTEIYNTYNTPTNLDNRVKQGINGIINIPQMPSKKITDIRTNLTNRPININSSNKSDLVNAITTNTSTTKESNLNLQDFQDATIPALEYMAQSKLASKMERVGIPKAEQLTYNPNDYRFNADSEINKLQTNANQTAGELRRNSSNPYYANAVRANLMKDVNAKTGDIYDKTNKLNLDITRENNAGFNRVNEANVNIRNNEKQANYNKTMADLTRRGSILGNTVNRTIEGANNKRALELDKMRLSTEAAKYAGTIGEKWSKAAVNGTIPQLVEQSIKTVEGLNTKATLNNKETQALENGWSNILKHYKDNNIAIPEEHIKSLNKLGYKVNGYTFAKQ